MRILSTHCPLIVLMMVSKLQCILCDKKSMTLLSEIHKTQTREAELKEKISKLQAELHSKEKEIKECEVKLLSLEEQKKKSVLTPLDS